MSVPRGGVAVVIPTWNGEAYLRRQLPALRAQRPPPDEIIVVDSSSRDGTIAVAAEHGCTLRVIPQREFNHGGTRNLGVSIASADIAVLVFLTQDAFPEDPSFLASLTRPIAAGEAAAAYARQLPYPGATPPEVFARSFNYPPEPHRRTAADIEVLGLRAFFFSNVASAVDRIAFERVGGFPDNVIMNEDMVLCAKLLAAGGTVAYAAEACVRHSHDYSLAQQFRRYFDIGAFLSTSDLVKGSAGGHGISFALGQLWWCWRNGARAWIPRCMIESLLKFVAIQLGKRQRRLPRWLKQRCSMHAFHWR